VPDEPNYLKAAFKSQYNIIGLGTALGFAVLSGTALPLLIAAGVELVVLPLVSGNGRFQRLMKARAIEDREEAAQEKVQIEATELLRSLSDFERGRYRQLQQLGQEIRHNYGSLDSSSQMLLADLEHKLDFLLSFYLRMRSSMSRYERYFATTNPEQIQERIAMLDHEMAQAPAKVQQVKARTKSVLEKRMERYGKALENKTLIDAQTETVQEVLQLLRDQSYSMRDPRTITEQLDGLVSSAEQTERGVRDMEDILSMEGDALMGGGGSVEDIERELERGRAAMPQPVTGGGPPQAAAPKVAPPPLRNAPPPPPPPPARKKVTN
jgi:hypothetical protein